MKSDLKTEKRRIAAEAEQTLKATLNSFSPNNFKVFGEMCNSLCVLREYSLGVGEKKARQAFKNYLRTVYDKHIVLILSYKGHHCSYTRNYLVKFIRGESRHGHSEIKDLKRTALHDFVFETDKQSQHEFFISWNYIAGPNLRAESGNYDTGGPYVHIVSINNQKHEVSLVESIILFICYEYWQTAMGQVPLWSEKLRIAFEPDDYLNLWGNERVQNIKSQKAYWQSCLSYFQLKDENA